MSCAALHLRSQRKVGDREFKRRLDAGDALYHCQNCPIGAYNSGRKPPPPKPEHRNWCVRCNRPATRLIFGRLCLSCYNRESEWRRGRNARGSYPSQYRPPLRIAVTLLYHDGRLVQVVVEAITPDEVKRIIERKYPDAAPTGIHWPATAPQPPPQTPARFVHA